MGRFYLEKGRGKAGRIPTECFAVELGARKKNGDATAQGTVEENSINDRRKLRHREFIGWIVPGLNALLIHEEMNMVFIVSRMIAVMEIATLILKKACHVLRDMAYGAGNIS